MSTRQAKIQELLKEEISDVFLKDFSDPRLGFITVIDVQVTSDLQHAKVFVSIMGSEQDRAQNMKMLKKAQGFVRAALGRRLHMKTLPEIDFQMDTTVDKGIRILELLEQG